MRALHGLHDRPVNYAVTERPTETGDGWYVDAYRLPLPPEPPGPPVQSGSWAIAQQVIRDYEFADPRLIRAVYYPDSPLQDRDMLLIGRFFGLRFRMGVRVGGVMDQDTEMEGRPVRIWGWDYRTLEGHLEAGQMDYEVWKWQDTGEVEFHVSRFVRKTGYGHPIVRLGFRVFGRFMQQLFVRRAFRRMERFVRAGLGQGAPPASKAAEVPASRQTEG
ncbi:DUF1990 domain-containing protein [soil metagenome]